MQSIDKDQVLEALKSVQDPDLKQNIVSLGYIKNLVIENGSVSFDLQFTSPARPVYTELKRRAEQVTTELPGVTDVSATIMLSVKRAPQAQHQTKQQQAGDGLANVKNVIAVASGKGGVGKSTVAVNLALSLSKTGAKVGLMDADVYGPSVPTMLKGNEAPVVQGQSILPIEGYGIKIMSMGLLSGPNTPVIWRGPMASNLIQQFLNNVEWGELDYLLIDLPPGTGDVQLTLTQSAPLDGAVVVTTPQQVAVGVTLRGINMFEKVNVPILGIVENMSHFECPHCKETTDIFPHGGGEQAAAEWGYYFLGGIPIDPSLALAGDKGIPVIESASDSPAFHAFAHIAEGLVARISVANEMNASATHSPKQVTAEDGNVTIEWSDDTKSIIPYRTLRFECPCAQCRDEWTGERRIELSDIPKDIYPKDIRRVGRYALQIIWSDQHSTGIYPYAKLYEMGK